MVKPNNLTVEMKLENKSMVERIGQIFRRKSEHGLSEKKHFHSNNRVKEL
jgi:hypothetical protein